ncbi:hypothetical protein GGR52DRAFT_356522 [Hypoxylon sp. FL1284]|nr:hypothetical protein GGR52DRAFT_356522 [Hypoxylon sp. FL1284]
MPSVTTFQPPSLLLGKKRRRDDDHSEVQMPMTTRYDAEPQDVLRAIDNNSSERLVFPNSLGRDGGLVNVQRKVIPMPVSKRLRVVGEPHPGSEDGQGRSPPPFHGHGHPPESYPAARTTAAPSPRALLSPCHICHRKPTKRSDLDSFADCMGCGRRACFVCIRACQGWLPPSCAPDDEDGGEDEGRDDGEDLSSSFTMVDADADDDEVGRPDRDPDESSGAGTGEGGQGKGDGRGLEEGWTGRGHRAVVCSRCCVERGSEGDVVCLGCLAWMEGL